MQSTSTSRSALSCCCSEPWRGEEYKSPLLPYLFCSKITHFFPPSPSAEELGGIFAASGSIPSFTPLQSSFRELSDVWDRGELALCVLGELHRNVQCSSSRRLSYFGLSAHLQPRKCNQERFLLVSELGNSNQVYNM